MEIYYDYKNLPPFTKSDFNLDNWKKEAPGVLELFRNEVYGKIPDEQSIKVSFRVAETKSGFMENRATRKIIEVSVKRNGMEFSFPFYLFLPNGADNKPVPVFLSLLNFSMSDGDPARHRISQFWPAEVLIGRGYGAAALFAHEVASDFDEGFTSKIYRLFPDYAEKRPPDTGGSITTWAWAMSRVIDYLTSDPCVNSKEIAIVGHSRGGKTSLWCGAQDTRVALVVSSCSGCSGTAITRGKTGERIGNITSRFPYWFCENYKKYANQEDTMPFDQHMLLALVAPRLLYISGRSYDSWCDPKAEYLSLKNASRVFNLYAKGDLSNIDMPAPEKGFVSANIGYHLKSGEHGMEEYDWERFINFADMHFNLLEN